MFEITLALSTSEPWRPLATIGDMLENDHFGGNPIKNENLSLNAILLSITLKNFLWPHETHSHGWLRGSSSIQKNVYCGTPYYLPPLEQ